MIWKQTSCIKGGCMIAVGVEGEIMQMQQWTYVDLLFVMRSGNLLLER